MIQFTMRQATALDLDEVVALLSRRQHWLSERLSDQWQHKETFRDDMANHIALGETWVAKYVDIAVGTITVTARPNPRWTDTEQRTPALYVAKMATDQRYSGQGIGEAMIAWAASCAEAQNVHLLRWDAWTTSAGLQDYYRRLGADHVRTITTDTNGLPVYSGALFQLNTAVINPKARELHERLGTS